MELKITKERVLEAAKGCPTIRPLREGERYATDEEAREAGQRMIQKHRKLFEKLARHERAEWIAKIRGRLTAGYFSPQTGDVRVLLAELDDVLAESGAAVERRVAMEPTPALLEKLPRYDLNVGVDNNDEACGPFERNDPNGEWVKFEDIAKALRAARSRQPEESK